LIDAARGRTYGEHRYLAVLEELLVKNPGQIDGSVGVDPGAAADCQYAGLGVLHPLHRSLHFLVGVGLGLLKSGAEPSVAWGSARAGSSGADWNRRCRWVEARAEAD